MDIRVLGPLEAVQAGQPVDLGSPKQRLVLSMLICRAEQLVSTDSLVDALWADKPPASARDNVHQYVHRLRKALGAQQLVSRGRLGYCLSVKRSNLDMFRFIDLIADGRRAMAAGEAVRSTQLLRDALSLWRGDPFADLCDEPALQPEIAKLQELRLDALEHRIDADLALGDYGHMVFELRQLVERHPYRERFHEQLMLSLYQSGQQAAALAAYQHARKTLADDLGLEPAVRLRQLENAMLNGEPIPGQEDSPKAHVVPTQLREAAVATPHYLPADTAGFAGREDHLRALDSLVPGPPAAGASRVLVISGMAGVGKTALAVHWAHRETRWFPDGQLYVNLRGYAPEAPLTALSALTLLLRALGVPSSSVPIGLDEAAGLYRSVLDGRSILLILDNALTAEQVRPLLPGGGGCTVLVTSRDRLTGLVARDNARRLRLGLLSEAESVALLHNILDGTSGADDKPALTGLAAACGYLPLALRIAAAKLADGCPGDMSGYVRALSADSWLQRLSVNGDAQSSVQAAFELSYRLLTPSAQRLFRLLSLVPTNDLTTHATAALLRTDPECALELLDILADAHLSERAGGRYGLHDLLRHYGNHQAGLADDADERPAAIGRLCDFYLGTINAAARLLYRHTVRIPDAECAGSTSLAFAEAADARQWLDAELSNVVMLIRYVSLHGPMPMAWLLADALRGYFWIRRPVAEWLATAGDGLTAAEEARVPHAVVAMHLSLGQAHRSLGQIPVADQHLCEALEISRSAGWPQAQVSALGQLAVSHAVGGFSQRAIERLGEALAINQRLGRPSAEAVILTNRGALRYHLGDLRSACADAEAALLLYRATGNLSGEAVALSNLGINHVYLGIRDHASRYLAEGQRVGEQIGDQIALALSGFGFAKLHCEASNYGEALCYAEAAAELARATGDIALATICTVDLAMIRQALRHSTDSASECEQALAAARQARNIYAEAWALIGLARANAHGLPRKALAHAREAVLLANQCQYRILEGEALRTCAELLAATGEVAEALDAAETAGSVLAECGYCMGAQRARKLFSALRDTSK